MADLVHPTRLLGILNIILQCIFLGIPRQSYHAVNYSTCIYEFKLTIMGILLTMCMMGILSVCPIEQLLRGIEKHMTDRQPQRVLKTVAECYLFWLF